MNSSGRRIAAIATKLSMSLAGSSVRAGLATGFVSALCGGCVLVADDFHGLTPRRPPTDAGGGSLGADGSLGQDAASGGACSARVCSAPDASEDSDAGGVVGAGGTHTGGKGGSGSGGLDSGNDGGLPDAPAETETGGGPPFVVVRQSITAPVDDAALSFGRSVALSGDGVWALVGANEATGTGLAYVLRRDASREWKIVQKLTTERPPPDEEQGFGASVAIAGNQALVGAPGRPWSYGLVYFFRRSPNDDVWKMEQPEENGRVDGYGDQFGLEVAASEVAAAVGAPGSDNGGAVFTLPTDFIGWGEAVELPAPEPVLEFGRDVEMDPGNLIVCSRGAAYVFEWTLQAWVYRQKLLPEAPDAGFCAAHSLALSGDTLLIGTSMGGARGVYVFTRTAGAWAMSAERIVLPSKFSSLAGHFGFRNALCGDTAVVVHQAGSLLPNEVFFYRRSQSGWNFRGLLSELIPGANVVSAACDGRTIALGDAAVPDSSGGVRFLDISE